MIIHVENSELRIHYCTFVGKYAVILCAENIGCIEGDVVDAIAKSATDVVHITRYLVVAYSTLGNKWCICTIEVAAAKW